MIIIINIINYYKMDDYIVGFQKTLLMVSVLAILSPLSYAEETSSNNTQLKTIVVTAALTEQNVDKAPASISVVTAEDIERSAALSVAEVLQQEAGLYNYSTGQDKVIIRGMRDTSGSYTMILLNGKRMSSNSAMWRGNDFDWSAIPLNSIERIEVIRGPMSSLYGSEAMGGVINIITKKGQTGQVEGSVFAQYNVLDRGDGKNQMRYGANLRGGLTDTLSFNLSADAYHRDAWYLDNAAGQREAYFMEKDTQNVTGSLTWEVTPAQTLDLDLSYNHDERPFLYDTPTTYAEMEMERWNIGLTHRGSWDWGKTEAYIGKEHSDIFDNDSEYDTPKARHYKQENLIGRAFANFDWLNNNTTTGVDYKEQKISDTAGYDSGGSEQQSYGVFIQNATDITDHLTLTLGGRYDDFDNYEGKATGKAYLAYEFAEGVVLKGGWGQAYKAPSPYHLNEDYSMVSCRGSCYVEGNPNLKAEESNNYELSFIYNRNRLNFGLTAYQNDVTNLIEVVTKENIDPNRPLHKRSWNNIAKAKMTGGELTLGYQFTDHFSVKTNTAYLDAKDTKKNVKLTERPEWTSNLMVNWEPVNNFRIAADANYTGQQVINASTGKELGGYTTYNLAFSSDINPSLKLDYGIKNLGDIDLEDKDSDFSTKLYGRNYFAKLTYNF